MEEVGFFDYYYEHKFPLDPKTYRRILTLRLGKLTRELGEGNPVIIALTVIISLIANLHPSPPEPQKRLRNGDGGEGIMKKNLWLLSWGRRRQRNFWMKPSGSFNGTK